MVTVVLFVDDGDSGPVEVGHDVLQSFVEQRLAGVQVDGELAHLRLQIHPRLQVGDVEGVADGVDVGAEQRVTGTEHCLHAELHLLARCQQRVKQQLLSLFWI